MKGVADTFGREPVVAYPWLVAANVFAPLAAVAVVALPVAAWRSRRHVVVWAAVPFVLAHSLISHKEERFLFPLVFVVPTLVVLAFGGPRTSPSTRRVVRGALIASLPVMLLFLVHPLGFRAQLRFAREAAELPLGTVVLMPRGAGLPWYPFFSELWSITERPLESCVESPGALVYADVPEPTLPPLCDGSPSVARPVVSELPFATIAPWRRLATRAADAWNGARALPQLRLATVVRVEAARPPAR